MFHILPDHFFILLSTPGKIVYWDCICKLFTIMDNQLSFGVERGTGFREYNSRDWRR